MRPLLAGILVLILATPACAHRGIDKNEFVSSLGHEDISLPLRGVGVKRLMMMRVFIAAFYLDKHITPQQALDDVPKRLEVKFFTAFRGADFTAFTIDSMKKNISPLEFKAINDRIPRMQQLFPNIRLGDVFSLTYKLGQGTIFALNGKERGIIPGADFARAIFATWIGPRPIDDRLKREVLGLEDTANAAPHSVTQ